MKSPPLGCGLKTSSPVSLFFELPWSLLPRLLYSPWASSFQAWGLGKGSHQGFSVGAREDPQCPGWVTLVPPPTHTRSPRGWGSGSGDHRWSSGLIPSPPPSQLPFTSPRPTALQGIRPQVRPPETFSFSTPGRPLAVSDVGQGTMREFCDHRKIPVVKTKWDSGETNQGEVSSKPQSRPNFSSQPRSLLRPRGLLGIPLG